MITFLLEYVDRHEIVLVWMFLGVLVAGWVAIEAMARGQRQ